MWLHDRHIKQSAVPYLFFSNTEKIVKPVWPNVIKMIFPASLLGYLFKWIFINSFQSSDYDIALYFFFVDKHSTILL